MKPGPKPKPRSRCKAGECQALGDLSTGFCGKHRQRFQRYGDPLHPFQRAMSGEGTRRDDGYIVVTRNGVTKYQHVMVAEQALGKALPVNAVVHHVDENPSNNDPSNLVICPDDAYHLLLHQRLRAFAATGHYDWRLCCRCSTYDAPENLHVGPSTYHSACNVSASRR